MEDDWDLHAVVRGCAASASSPPPAVGLRPLQEAMPPEKQECFFSSSTPWGRFQARKASEELQELYMPFFPKSFQSLSPQNMSFLSPPPPSPSFAGSNLNQRQRLEPLKQHQKQLHAVNSQSNRSKRRKSQMKRVCHVPAEELTSDVWAWRKYGQKPIKGSPYPRGYYRCSSSKGCLARKQVERNKTDPAMFIVTYTAEHNHPAPTHRNSLAGSTRQKPSAASAGEGDGDAADKEASKSSPCPCSPGSGVSNTTSSPLPPELVKAESSATDQEDATTAAAAEEDEDEELGGLFSEVMDGIDDDFFMGLEELTGFVGDCFPGHSPAAFSLHWGANSAAAAAGGD